MFIRLFFNRKNKKIEILTEKFCKLIVNKKIKQAITN